MMKAMASTVACAALALLAGCGGPERPTKDYKWHSGKGKVLVGQTPLKGGGSIIFSPANDPNFTTEGAIQADGTFVLATKMHNPRKDGPGAPVGDYNVRVLDSEAGKGGPAIDVPGTVAVPAGDAEIVVKIRK